MFTMKRDQLSRKLVLTVLVALALAGTLVTTGVAHASPTHTTTPAAPAAGACDHWTTLSDGGVQATGLGSIDVHPVLEAEVDASGAYCGYLRGKNTVTRGSGDCNTNIGAASQDGNGLYAGLNEVEWTGCGGTYYALFGYAFCSCAYTIPFDGLAGLDFGNNSWSWYGTPRKWVL